jgi:hypothetical protein
VNITKCFGPGSNFYWFQWQSIVDEGSVFCCSLAVLLEIALDYQTDGVLEVVMMQTCEYVK